MDTQVINLDTEIAKAQVELNTYIKQAEVVSKYLDDLLAMKKEIADVVEDELS